MKFIVCVSLLFSVFSMNSESPKMEWGKTGHRTTAEIAANHLNKKAETAVEDLLDGRSLAFVSTFADEIKSDSKYAKYSPWHYVNIDARKKEYDPKSANPDGDLVQGIRKCEQILSSKTASKNEKRFYLKFLVHLVADLHQPLHAGRSEDRGGNDIKVKWFGESSNLHRVWDSDMLDSYQMSYTELADNTEKLSKLEIRNIEKGKLLDWVNESRDLSKKVYHSVKDGDDLGYRYMYFWFPTVLEQLQKGGIRLAEILNRIYS